MSEKKAACCPCGNTRAYQACCGPLHKGGKAPTAESLMRSRYSAYVLRLEAYLLDTWHTGTRPATLELGPPSGAGATRWLGLEIRKHQETGNEAIVEFVARYRVDGKGARLHEISRFRREGDDRWYYVDGDWR